MLNWSYTTAVFTSPGSTTDHNGYGLLPTSQGPSQRSPTSFTVKSNGELRFCKKCQARKPDRAHHCSTCRRCVLKMDHHCPWLATCLGLRNYKPFLLFLVYTTLLCFYSFGVSFTWAWYEVILEETREFDALLPVNFLVLTVVSGIIGIVVGAFTGWHIMLATRGQTTIECLEKTRYLSPLRQTYRMTHNPSHRLPQAAQQIVDFHANALPGITRPEEGEERNFLSNGTTPPAEPQHTTQPFDGSRPTQLSYQEREREESRRRYEEYLDDQDSSKMPNAFDLGWKRNLRHLLGSSSWLWAVPICNTSGDGWSWEASPKWLEARDRVKRERDEQRQREINAGWGNVESYAPGPGPYGPPSQGMHPTKADRVLGRDPSLYADDSQGIKMKRFTRRGRSADEELLQDTDEEADGTVV